MPARQRPIFRCRVPPRTLDDAKALSVRLGNLTLEIARGEAFFLADDWRTQGDWIGRYGSGLCQALRDRSRTGIKITHCSLVTRLIFVVGPHHEANVAGPVWYP